ncbi:uncharacterized protein LOC130655181 [Hydractinia symbiolongicarpus]|uniref:uncharacterized protein LOC130655181 n=1 Tax=Hydractinia symbiolongicarpus TaxID=13093 RepID=UPI00254F2A43|nr:uncharacterized protein LOC130655181 [Hydractinia symbiolongicarpus]
MKLVFCVLVFLCIWQPGFTQGPRKYGPGDYKNVSCHTCKVALKSIGTSLTLLGTNKTESKIKSIVKNVCGTLDEIYTKECGYLTGHFSKYITTCLLKNMNASSVCGDKQICKVAKKQIVIYP